MVNTQTGLLTQKFTNSSQSANPPMRTDGLCKKTASVY